MWKPRPHSSETRLRMLVTVLFVCGTAGLVLTGLLGFEAPNNPLLLLSSALLLAPVLTVFAHLGLTRALTRPQKRVWLRKLTSRKAACSR